MSDWTYLDRQLADAARTAPAAPVFRAGALNPSALASGLAANLRRVLRMARLEWPSIIEELDSPVSLLDRHDSLIGYYHLMERGDSGDPVLERARIVNQLYFDLSYFRNQILELLRREILSAPSKFEGAPYLSEWLDVVGKDAFGLRLKALRNAFAHGTWCYLRDFSGIEFHDHESPKSNTYLRYQMSQTDLQIVHVLLYAFHIVLFQIAREEGLLGTR